MVTRRWWRASELCAEPKSVSCSCHCFFRLLRNFRCWRFVSKIDVLLKVTNIFFHFFAEAGGKAPGQLFTDGAGGCAIRKHDVDARAFAGSIREIDLAGIFD